MKLSEISANEMRSAIEDKQCAYFAVTSAEASDEQVFQACAMVIRELMSRLKTVSKQNNKGKKVHYMSMEFLIGRSLMKNAYNLGCGEQLTQALEDMYPELKTGSEREKAYVKEHKTACIMQIGGKLRSGKPHDGRAPDYDDWQLNCDILFWDEVLQRPLEISSMGIRVDRDTLDRQLKLSGCDDRRNLPFHKMLLNDELPLTIGGGIGQSRLSMLMMGCAHIGEVQSSIWDADTILTCEEAGIPLL